MTKLRPLSPAEQDASDMMRAGGDIAVVSDQTRLSRSQVLAAVDLAKAWEDVYLQTSTATGKPTVPAPAPVSRVRSEAPLKQVVREPQGPVAAAPVEPVPLIKEPEPETAPESVPDEAPVPDEPPVWTDITRQVLAPMETVHGRQYEDDDPGEDDDGPVDPGEQDAGADIPGLLERAMASGSLRAHDLARTVQRHVGEIRSLLANEEQATSLRAAIAGLKAELAEKEQALAEIDGPTRLGTVAPRPPRRQVGKPIDRKLYYSTEVREWAVANNHPVAAKGQMPKAVVEAYIAAHATAAA